MRSRLLPQDLIYDKPSIITGLAGASDRDKRISVARANLDWNNHLNEAMDSKVAQRMHDEACAKSSAPDSAEGDYCTMCGREWCSVRINKELKEKV